MHKNVFRLIIKMFQLNALNPDPISNKYRFNFSTIDPATGNVYCNENKKK